MASVDVEFVPWAEAPWWIRWTVLKWHDAEWPATHWMTVYPRVFHPNGVQPGRHPDIIDHEMVHWPRQKEAGVWWWVIKYLASKNFRRDEEVLALAVDIRSGRLSKGGAVDYLQSLGITDPRPTLMAMLEEASK